MTPPHEQSDEHVVGLGLPSLNAQHPHNVFRTRHYTWLSFVPLNLFEQFRRVANLFFLIIFALQLVPGVSPYPWWTTAAPLTFILGVTFCKDFFEERRRHKVDAHENARLVHRLGVVGGGDGVVGGGRPCFRGVPCSALRAGDVVRIRRNEACPADVVLLHEGERPTAGRLSSGGGAASEPSCVCPSAHK